MNKIGILGFGNIGHATFDIINNLKEDVKVVKVFDIPGKKDVLGSLLVTDYHEITEDKDIDIVIEALGGDEVPYQAISSALKHGKSVVTSNKMTVSLHLNEYFDLAKKNNCLFRFEASVGGGIPLIGPIQNIIRYDEIKSFKGILNGTTNYMLTRIKEGLSFDAALKEAQDKGFAERDPSADLMGLDMARKGMILSDLIYDGFVSYDDVPHFGIENLNDTIFNKISSLENKVLKMVVSGKMINDKLSLIVVPTILSKSNFLASMDYEFNGCVLDCLNNGTLSLIGKGAGGGPTGSAMVQDVLAILDKAPRCSSMCTKPLEVTFDNNKKFMVFDEKNESKIISVKDYKELQQYKFVAELGD